MWYFMAIACWSGGTLFGIVIATLFSAGKERKDINKEATKIANQFMDELKKGRSGNES